MAKNLVIVESPAKAKTIEGFLGKDFLVKSSFGHVRDLKSKDLSIDTENDFKPTYEISADKKKIVSELKKLSSTAEMVWLATDEDREGEAISWHLFEALNLKEEKVKRIAFHEITKSAILNAIENPRKIDKNLVDAQQARRILDRLVGFELSPVLWRKIKPSLSAGRVQSVAVRLIVEREREIEEFATKSFFKTTANFPLSNKQILKAELTDRFKDEKNAVNFLNSCIGASYKVADLETKPGKKSPSAPFTTSTLQQEASRKLGFSVAQTMTVAQKLYEAGKITYMRTDSVNLSDTAVDAAKKEIISNYGVEYSNPKKYVTKAKGAQEAHEAIRPTYMENSTTSGDNSERKLYELIWKRTLASQMTDALLEKTTATIDILKSNGTKTKEKFIAQGEVLKFEGFLKVYLESKDDDDDEQKGMLPEIKVNETLNLDTIESTERFTHHPPRYSEASLVKKLEENGIGRPSTYAPTISTIQKRGYVTKEDREGTQRQYMVYTLQNDSVTNSTKIENTGKEKSKLFPSDIGMVVNDFLVENFSNVLDYGFTASVEEEFDDIAEGKRVWNDMIRKFYSPFHKTVEDTMENSERASGERLLGIDPKTGFNVYARLGRFGPMVQLGESDKEEKPKFASIQGELSLNSITLEQAIELFKLPKTVGLFEDKEVVIAIGKFGPYVRHNNQFFSIPKGDDPMTVDLKTAINLIEEKRIADNNRIIKEFSENKDLQVLNGRYGPYISMGKKNFKIPSGQTPAELTYEQCMEIVNTPYTGKKKSSKKK